MRLDVNETWPRPTLSACFETSVLAAGLSHSIVPGSSLNGSPGPPGCLRHQSSSKLKKKSSAGAMLLTLAYCLCEYFLCTACRPVEALPCSSWRSRTHASRRSASVYLVRGRVRGKC